MTLQRPRGFGGRSKLRALVAGLAASTLLVAAVAPAFAAFPTSTRAAIPGIKTAQVQLRVLAAGMRLPGPRAILDQPFTSPDARPDRDKDQKAKSARWTEGRGSRLVAPFVPALPVVPASTPTSRSGAVGFDGISGREMRLATTVPGQRQNWSIEPPDMGLCVGNGQVMEAVNGATVVTDINGNRLTAVTPLAAFYGLAPEYPSGPSVGDPSCLFDPATNRFFMTSYAQLVSGALGTMLAVSDSGDAAFGSWTSYFLPDIGGVVLPGCAVACFPDYPHIGLDANGLWLTNNEFDFGQPGFPYAGVTIWGISKRLLASHSNFILGDIWGLGFSGGIPLAFTVMPAFSGDGTYDQTAGGTQYFLATRDMDGTRDNVVDVWAAIGTGNLNLTSPGFPGLQRVQLTTETYACECQGTEPAGGATQKFGPYPQGQSLGLPLPRLDTNDDRMHQVVYSNGSLWAAAGSVMQVAGSVQPTVGVAWFVIGARNFFGNLVAGVQAQGYIGVKDSYAWFPAVGVTSSVRGVVAFSLSGPNYYPSVAYAQFDPWGGATSVRIAAAGALPADGFTQIPGIGRNGTERWGDYNAAAIDGRGNIWFAAEYVPATPRWSSINWGTWVGSTYPQ